MWLKNVLCYYVGNRELDQKNFVGKTLIIYDKKKLYIMNRKFMFSLKHLVVGVQAKTGKCFRRIFFFFLHTQLKIPR